MALPSQVAYFHNDHDHPVPADQVLQAIAYEPCSYTEDTIQLDVKKIWPSKSVYNLGGNNIDLGVKVGYHDHKKEDDHSP